MLLLVLFVSLSVSCNEAATILPNYVKICKRNDPQLSQCWKNTFQSLRPYLVKGIPEFDIPPIDPLRVTELTLNQGNSSNANFELVMSDVDFEGAKDYEILDAAVDIEKLTFYTKIRFPLFTLSGNYKSKGRFLLFRFDSDGRMYGNATEAILSGTWYGKTYIKKGVKHMKIIKQEADVSIAKLHVQFDNLFRENSQLNANVNQVINENSEALFEDIKPLLSEALGAITSQYSNRAYRAFPFDVLYPEK